MNSLDVLISFHKMAEKLFKMFVIRRKSFLPSPFNAWQNPDPYINYSTISVLWKGTRLFGHTKELRQIPSHHLSENIGEPST